MPSSSRDFQRAAGQRLAAAEELFAAGFNLDAQYIGGYVVECSLKALILHDTPDAERPAMFRRLTESGGKMHRYDVLRGILGEVGSTLPVPLSRRLRRFDWSTGLRYEFGRADTGETRGLLKTAKAIYNHVEKCLP